MLLPAILMTAAFPALARAHGDVERQRRWETLIAAVLLSLGLLVGVLCHLGSERIIGLAFGRDFGRAVASLGVLACGIPLLYLNHGLLYFLIARDLGHKNLVFAGLMLVVNVTVNLILIPRFGGPGAGWATVLTEAALLACCLTTLALGSRRPAGPAPG
jgi:O-antigen/teichoic acid export membrane protein